MIPYIFHVSILLAICYLLYRLLWEKETYFQLNRWILITCLLLSFGLPLLTVPEGWSLQKRVVQQEVLSTEKLPFPTSTLAIDNKVIGPIKPDKELVATRTNKESAKEVTEITSPSPIAIQTQNDAFFSWNFQLNFWQLLQYLYLGGIVLFVLNFLIQLLLIIFQKATNPTLQDGRYTIVEINQDKAPFSFGNSIFINPTKYDWETYNQILEHEKIHIAQRHTIDILLAELVVILQWFNPFAWLYRKAVEINLEYLTDYKMLHKGTEREIYQLNLLRVSVPQLPLNLTTNYNQSFLKKRIAMMNVKKSSARSSWKYLLLLPLLALTVITLNPVQLQSQNEQPKPEAPKVEKKKSDKKGFFYRWWGSETPTPPTPPAPPVPPTPSAPVIPSAPVVPAAPPAPPAPPKPGKISGNSNSSTHTVIQHSKDGKSGTRTVTTGEWTSDEAGEVTTMAGDWTLAEAEDRNFKEHININGAATFEEEEIILHSGEIKVNEVVYNFSTTGNWSGELRDGEVCLQLSNMEKHNNYTFTLGTCLEKDNWQPTLTRNIEGPFKLGREAGTLTLKGVFEDGEGFGRYAFEEAVSFRNYLQTEGYDYVEEDLMFHLFIADFNKAYVNYLKKEGYDKLSKRELEILVHHGLTQQQLEDYIATLNRLNFDKPSLKDLAQLAIHDIEPDYIQKMGGELFKDLKIEQIVEAAIHDVDPNYIKEIKALGYTDLAFKEIIEFSIHGIDVDYVQKLKESGLDLSKKEIIEAAIHGIDADFIKAVKATGFKNITFKDIVEFGIHGIDANYIKALKEAGLENLSKQQITEAAIHGIDANRIKAFQDLGFDNLSFKEIIELNMHGVDADDVKGFKEAGYDHLSARELTEASIHGVDPDEVKEFTRLGFNKIPIRKLIELKIHGVNPSYIERIQKSGTFKALTLDEYIEMKIHGIDKKMKREE